MSAQPLKVWITLLSMFPMVGRGEKGRREKKGEEGRGREGRGGEGRRERRGALLAKCD